MAVSVRGRSRLGAADRPPLSRGSIRMRQVITSRIAWMSRARTPQESAAALDAAIDTAQRLLLRLGGDASLQPLRPGGWCARETLGHLLDSACNNLRRFVIGQPPGVDRFDGYRQDEWVSRQAHRDRPWHSLMTLWTEYNRHLAHVMRHTSDAAAEGSA